MADSISLDDLIALNDEIVGLTRAGVPLELGLASWSGGVRGRLGRIVGQVGQSVEQGQSLPQALTEHAGGIPPAYRAIVTAGLKSGRLPAALESLATSARNLKEIRTAIGLAVLYPLIVALIAYFLFLLIFSVVLPNLMLLYEDRPPQFWQAVLRLGDILFAPIPLPFTNLVIYACWIPPVLLLSVVGLWWLGTRRAVMVDMGTAGRWLSLVPVAGSVVRDAKVASMAEVFGTLIEHGVPLQTALTLSADCTADRQIIRSARKLASGLDQGTPPSELPRAGLPPLLAWLISSGARQQTLVTMARNVAETHRRRALLRSQWLRDYLPVWLMLFVGVLVVGLFALTIFVPFTQLMQALSGNLRDIRIR